MKHLLTTVFLGAGLYAASCTRPLTSENTWPTDPVTDTTVVANTAERDTLLGLFKQSVNFCSYSQFSDDFLAIAERDSFSISAQPEKSATAYEVSSLRKAAFTRFGNNKDTTGVAWVLVDIFPDSVITSTIGLRILGNDARDRTLRIEQNFDFNGNPLTPYICDLDSLDHN